MKHAVAVDFGSTFTKVVCVDLQERKIVFSGRVPSTVGSDAAVGMEQCFSLVRESIGEAAFHDAAKYASSSAAGGLRMAVVGLTRSLSSLAASSAALGAGAKICVSYDGLLTAEDIRALEESSAEIILFCGGYEKGNTSLLIKNAEALAQSAITIPVIYAGNSEIAMDVRRMMMLHGKQCYVVENIIPKIGQLNVELVQKVIGNLFLERITNMKGLSEVKEIFDNDMVPTPAAVLGAGKLLSRGTPQHDGLGSIMIVDVGGSTTDVYSFCENRACDGAKLVGISEPYEKRTVEGDLGMRESSGNVMSGQRLERAATLTELDSGELLESVKKRMEHIAFVPDCESERKVDFAIGYLSAWEACRRHAGKVVPSFMKNTAALQYGKNLTGVKTVIGTGGIFIHTEKPAEILKAAEQTGKEKNSVLLPEQVEAYVDTEYVLFAAGLLKETDEDAAFEIMIKSLKKKE